MNKGKVTCEVLKEIRKQIADQNGIDYQTRECTFEGECRGTCPVCESEIHYLESEIVKKKYLGKAVVLAGLSVGLISGLTGCGHESHRKSNEKTSFENQKSNVTNVDTLSFQSYSPTKKEENNKKILPDLIMGKLELEPFSSIDSIINIDTNEIIIEGLLPLPTDSTLYEYTDQMPEFPGGKDSLMQYLKNELKYPNVGERNISGPVLIEFIVETDGSISNVHALVLLYPEFDEEAIRVIKSSPKWIPGMHNGKPVRVKYQIPIRFSME